MSHDQLLAFRDGHTATERFYWDGAALARQLGVKAIPATGTKASIR